MECGLVKILDKADTSLLLSMTQMPVHHFELSRAKRRRLARLWRCHLVQFQFGDFWTISLKGRAMLDAGGTAH